MERNSSEPGDHKVTISLRRFDPSDLDDLMEWVSDERVNRFSIGEPLRCKEEGLKYMEKSVFRVICVDGRAAGSISVDHNSDAHSCRALLGYMLGFEHWGKGIATRAIKMVVSAVFQECPQLERLEAFVDVDNGASLRVLEKAGFRREGVLAKYMLRQGKSRDMVVFSFLNTDSIVE